MDRPKSGLVRSVENFFGPFSKDLWPGVFFIEATRMIVEPKNNGAYNRMATAAAFLKSLPIN
jgi:hypothetical protein